MASRVIACGQLAARDLDEASASLADALDAIADSGRAGAELCVLPEGTYPGYVLGSADAGRAALTAGPDPVAAISAAARAAHIEVIAGIVLDEGDLLNAAVHFGSDGEIRGRAVKRFLWHFDRAWFAAGTPAEVVDGVGTLVCADGRLPEIAAGLVHRGAGLLVNSTAWVVSRPAPLGTNPQAEFLWRVRALESGVAAVACTKVGTEEHVAQYAGRSQIVAPDGTVVAVASATEAELLVAAVEVPERPRLPFGAPDLALADTDAPPPRTRQPTSGHAYVVVLADPGLAARIEHHGADLVVDPGGVVQSSLATATLRGNEMLAAGPPRRAAFEGAEVLVWMLDDAPAPSSEAVARTRALENRVFVAVWRPLDAGGPLVIGPSGAVLASGPLDAPHAVGASILPAEAASKTVAPGTDLFSGVTELGPVR